ncbi:MAG: CoA-binding protein [Peptococcaceae bacterium BRH_c4b]|nr:MAG: CoA-binding protein [Peptococcaceae bacterium BRH_c4b]
MKKPDDIKIKKILTEAKTIAVVGLSAKPHRASYRVAEYMQKEGYRIIPVNPSLKQEVLGERAYPDLASVPEKIDIVNIFRKSEDVPAVVEDALPVNPRCIWMQLGIVNEGAAARATENGIAVIMDLCLMVEHKRILGASTCGEGNL